MNHRKHRARLLGLLAVAALGVMAFAASAQAVVVPGFLVNKAAPALTKVKAELEVGTIGTMLVPGLNFELNCGTLTSDEPTEITSKTHAEATLLFTKCTTLSITKLPEEIHCHVTEPIVATSLLLPTELTSGAPAILAEKIKALIKLHLPEATQLGVNPCVLPLDNVVTGDVCFEIKTATNDTAKPLLYTDGTVQCKERVVLEGAEGVGVKDVVKYGTQTVTLDGKAELLATNPLDALLGVSLY